MTRVSAQGPISLLRNNYETMRYFRTFRNRSSEVAAATILNLDDKSPRLSFLLKQNVGQRGEIFVNGQFSPENTRTEFGSLLSSSVLVGFGYTF